ncbi:MAG: glycerophosphodiester phosphodiesterase [Acidobacteria bacterium]|nr:glycerophosphodiester phosphodiesterase [Acidobacteriota bacterium]MBV9145149.1 glycerophosphodiester phosphodiesterase [Acidobacteriota bacterium]MBV9437618.1 glycerophosphodiester phosphodiesterase [Acidobacteriota bacterium]
MPKLDSSPPGRRSGGRKSPLLLGHRGASKYAPENTLAAFDLALQHGCDGFEFDVRYTRDARCVICHDALHKRRKIERRTFADLKLPCADDVIRKYSPRAYLDIEVKVAGDASAFLAALKDVPPDRFIISSFLPDVLLAVNDVSPGIPLGLICENLRQLRRWESLPIRSVALYKRLCAPSLIDELHNAAKQVLVWTVNRERQMQEFADRGVDALISDDTRLLAQTFAREGTIA